MRSTNWRLEPDVQLLTAYLGHLQFETRVQWTAVVMSAAHAAFRWR
jgi:hypothetical protein